MTTIYFDGFGNLLLYSPNFLFDRKSVKLDTFNDKGDIETILSILEEEQKKDLKKGWTIKVKLPDDYEVIYFG